MASIMTRIGMTTLAGFVFAAAAASPATAQHHGSGQPAPAARAGSHADHLAMPERPPIATLLQHRDELSLDADQVLRLEAVLRDLAAAEQRLQEALQNARHDAMQKVHSVLTAEQKSRAHEHVHRWTAEQSHESRKHR
jgi:hypothetical protein